MRFKLIKSYELYYFLRSNGKYLILLKDDARNKILNYELIAEEAFEGEDSFIDLEGQLIASLNEQADLVVHSPELFRELMIPDELSFPYDSLSEFAEKHSRTDSNVRKLCRAGRIPGAVLIGSMWFIPKNADYPDDNRAGRIMPKRRKE